MHRYLSEYVIGNAVLGKVLMRGPASNTTAATSTILSISDNDE